MVGEEKSRRDEARREESGAEQHPAREKRVEEPLVGLDAEKPEEAREVVGGERFVPRQELFGPPEGPREILHQVPAVAEERHVDAEEEAGCGEEPQHTREEERSAIAARTGQAVDRRVEPALRARGDEERDQEGVRRGVDRPEEFEKVKSPGQLRREDERREMQRRQEHDECDRRYDAGFHPKSGYQITPPRFQYECGSAVMPPVKTGGP